MSATAPLDLRRPAADPRVQHVLMLRERIDKTARNGKPYAILKLGNASGEITANAGRSISRSAGDRRRCAPAGDR